MTDSWPDHATCLFCENPITWDEVCYVHDVTGFADCYLVLSGGRTVTVNAHAMQLDPHLAIELPKQIPGLGPDRYSCPICHWTSHNPNDIEQGYCGHCHAFTAGEKLLAYPDLRVT